MAVVLLQTSLSILQREMMHFEDHGFLSGIRGDDSSRRFRLRRRRRARAQKTETETIVPPETPAAKPEPE